jgi:hypothetical protein
MAEQVDHPDHYNSLGARCQNCNHPIECIDVIEHMSFPLGAIVKHLWRQGLKGAALTDLRKALWYLNREVARAELAESVSGLEKLAAKAAADDSFTAKAAQPITGGQLLTAISDGLVAPCQAGQTSVGTANHDAVIGERVSVRKPRGVTFTGGNSAASPVSSGSAATPGCGGGGGVNWAGTGFGDMSRGLAQWSESPGGKMGDGPARGGIDE